MMADDLERLKRIVGAVGRPKHVWFEDTEVIFLLELLTKVARTAAAPHAASAWYEDGEMDALAVLDTITGENHIQAGPNASLLDVLAETKDWPPKYL